MERVTFDVELESTGEIICRIDFDMENWKSCTIHPNEDAMPQQLKDPAVIAYHGWLDSVCEHYGKGRAKAIAVGKLTERDVAIAIKRIFDQRFSGSEIKVRTTTMA